MKKPKLEYLHNEPMIYKYAGQLELYCYELEKKIKVLEKALDKACELLESSTEDGLILCPCEYLGICHCESTESGYECNGDVDYKWKDALMKYE